MVEQKPTNISEIFNSSVLQIPNYQRNYSWRTKHVEDLLNDIEYLLKQERTESRHEDHYFGTIVLHEQELVSAGSDEFVKYAIVDGQQRLTTISIIVGAIIEEMESLDVDKDKLSYAIDPPDRQVYSLEAKYLENSGQNRLELHNEDNLIFNRLVRRKGDPSDIDADSVSEENLLDAKKEIKDWLENKKSGQTDTEYYKTLVTIIRLINNRFEVTRYKVDSISEAGRIFETLNDRGRTLTIADKIKSYLVYCANRIDEDSLANDVFEEFGQVIHNITSEGTESDLTEFIREHWRLFSGEIQYSHSSQYDITDLHRRIKTVDKHIPLQRSDSEIKEYIENYLESLLECSESYQKVIHPENIDAAESDLHSDIQNTLNNVHENISDSNIEGLLIALHIEFGFSEEFYKVIELLEAFGWRAYQVCRANSDYRRRKFREIAHATYYAGNPSKAASIFDGMTSNDFEVFDGKEEAYESLCREIENAIGSYGPNTAFEKNLKRSDIFDGDINEDGWNGFQNKSTVKHLLYEFELSFESPPASVTQLDRSKFSLEHILPESESSVPNEVDIEHTRYVDSLGNLALLHPDDDSTDESQTYEEKHEEIYRHSSMQMLNELPDPSSTNWDAREIESRLDNIVDFALERWNVETGAYVSIGDVDGGTKNDVISILRPEIEAQFESLEAKPPELNNLPKVVPTEGIEKSEMTDGRVCPSCDSFKFDAVIEDGSVIIECECGHELEQPIFGLFLESHSLSQS